MQIKVFKIRLSKDEQENDEKRINEFMLAHKVIKTASNFVESHPCFWSVIVYFKDNDDESQIQRNKSTEKYEITESDELDDYEKRLFTALKNWRIDRSKFEGLTPFLICHNTELMSVAKRKPQNLEQLYEIKGFGEHKIAKYGEEIIAIVNSAY